MKRRTREKKDEGVRLSRKALGSLRASKFEPGFDYQATLRELNRVYDYDQIKDFCRYKGKGSISKIMSGKSIPSHPQGELIYILYIETFNKKEDFSKEGVPSNKPPNKSFQK